MSYAVPRCFMAIRSSNPLCPSSPYPAHCFSDAALERTKPGATLLTVIPNGPSSCASCRVKPTTACFAEQFEAAAVAGSGLVVRQQVLALHPLEVAAQHPRPAAERAPCCLRHHVQWQLSGRSSGPVISNLTPPHRPASAQHRHVAPVVDHPVRDRVCACGQVGSIGHTQPKPGEARVPTRSDCFGA